MDVLSFLRERTNFIRSFHEAAAEPFRETQRTIMASEAPFDNPPYSEDGEPPFVEEYMEAEVGLEVLGRTCISMLSASLQLYFMTWQAQLGLTWSEDLQKAFKEGFLRGYQTCFGEVLNVSWDECPANLALLDQVTLARNIDQHPADITTMRVTHRRNDLEKYPEPFFASEVERKMLGWMAPPLHVSRDNLFEAIGEVAALADWLEGAMRAARNGT